MLRDLPISPGPVTPGAAPTARRATDAVCDAVALDRRKVRETAVRRFSAEFSAERMVDAYLRVYTQVA
jgi:hypothetical protein